MVMLLSLLLAVDAALQPYVRVDSKAVVLEHVRVIDGTGAAAREDQTLFLVDGKIAGQPPGGAQRLALQGRPTIVFKQGIGFDSKKLVESVRGLAGMR